MSAKQRLEAVKADISRKEEGLAHIINSMQSTSGKLKETLAIFLIEKIQSTVQGAVVNNPEVAKTKGKEALSALKAEMNALISQVPLLIEQEYSNPSIWAHNIPSHNSTEIRGNSIPAWYPVDKYLDPIRNILGRVATILENNGFLAEKAQINNRAEPVWSKKLDGTFVYSKSFIFHSFPTNETEQKLKELTEKYNINTQALYGRYVELNNLQKQLSAAQNAAEAETLWEEA